MTLVGFSESHAIDSSLKHHFWRVRLTELQAAVPLAKLEIKLLCFGTWNCSCDSMTVSTKVLAVLKL